MSEEPDDQRSQRLRKLNALREAGADPFVIERYNSTHSAAAVVDPAAPHWSLPDEEREQLGEDFGSHGSQLLATSCELLAISLPRESGHVQYDGWPFNSQAKKLEASSFFYSPLGSSKR